MTAGLRGVHSMCDTTRDGWEVGGQSKKRGGGRGAEPKKRRERDGRVMRGEGRRWVTGCVIVYGWEGERGGGLRTREVVVCL